jgi:hypothetical protein
VDPRAGLDDAEKRKILPLPGLKLRPLGRPARSQSGINGDNIKMDTLEVGTIGALVNALVNLQFPRKATNLLTR